MNISKYNGLESRFISTSVKSILISSLDEIHKLFPNGALFVAYLYNRVIFGRLINNEFIYYNQNNDDFNLDNIIKMRVFNIDNELFLWREKFDRLKARLRCDDSGDECCVIDSDLILFGTTAEIIDYNFIKITEERGTEIIMPIDLISLSVDDIIENTKRLTIQTRSYVGFINDDCLASFEDVRFVKFNVLEERKWH